MTHSPPSLRDPAALLATWFGAGLLPKAPGTWGSLAALPFAWALVHVGGETALGLGVLLVFLAGWWAAGRFAAARGIDDPGSVVIDEVAGQWLALLAARSDLLSYAIGFLLFRVFDIVKPWPVNWADRNIGGGLGIMLDDVLAGLYALACMMLLQWMGGVR